MAEKTGTEVFEAMRQLFDKGDRMTQCMVKSVGMIALAYNLPNGSEKSDFIVDTIRGAMLEAVLDFIDFATDRADGDPQLLAELCVLNYNASLEDLEKIRRVTHNKLVCYKDHFNKPEEPACPTCGAIRRHWRAK